MKPLELTENEQQFLAEVMRTLELDHPEGAFDVRPSLVHDTPGGAILWIDATRIIEGVPQNPTVRRSIPRPEIATGDPEQLAHAMAGTIIAQWRGTNTEQVSAAEPARLPYGEWPAHNARLGGVALTWAVLVARHMEGDHLVLIGSCPESDYQGAHDCSAEAGGYRWTFRGAVFDVQAQEPGHVRLRIRSEGEFIAERMEAK